MKLGTFITIAAVIAIAFGVSFAVAPALMLTLYGIPSHPGTTILARFFGATLFNLGLVVFSLRNVLEPARHMGFVRASLIGTFLGLLVAIHGQRTGAVNALGWSSVAIYALLSLGYAYFALGNRQTASGSASSP
ncbi:MAG TPA: hypothetical protein VIM15_00200 [Gemmatimonadaceae bacterium]